MALADHPKSFILRMFAMEQREGRGEHCQVFPEGVMREELPLTADDPLYAIYKSRYFFTEKAMIIARATGMEKIDWAGVTACSSKHGDGSARARLTMTDGRTVEIDLREIVKGHSGRISQLIHGMIERWGTPGRIGPGWLTVEQFLAQASDEYAFAPNLSPHPSLGEISAALLALQGSDGVAQVLLARNGSADEELAIDRLIVVATALSAPLRSFSERFGASAIIPGVANTQRALEPLAPGLSVWEMLWD
jgi:hypothetical protein